MATGIVRLRLALPLALLATACLQDDGTRFNPIREHFEQSVDDERELGFRFDRDARQHLPLVDDLQVLEFVHDLGRELVLQVGSQPFVYRFRVIKDPALNAFAVPGGYVYLHSGTVLAANSVGELAGVLAHEIAHVKGRHYARMVEQAAIPNLLTGVAAIAATLATKEPGVAVAAQALNVALELRYSREFESEADRVGATLMARAGYDPDGMVHFFERIVLTERADPVRVPPYLYTHPEVEERISVVSDLAAGLRPRRPPATERAESMRQAQARLALLVETDRSAWATTVPFDRSRTDDLLKLAEQRAANGAQEEALEALDRAARLEPGDPRVFFRRAQLLEAAGRLDEAIAAYRRALDLDPSRALVFHSLGRAYKARGERSQAIFYLEQAARRAAPGRGLRERAEWEIEKLTFPVLTEAGLGAGPASRATHTLQGTASPEFGPEDESVVWWGRVGAHFLGYRELLSVRWMGPDDTLVLEEQPRSRDRVYAVSTLPLREVAAGRPGLWTLEARFEDDVVDRRTFRVSP